MRMGNDRYVACYSYTDDHVRFIARFSLLTGCLIGGMIVGVVMSIFQ